MRTFVVGRLIGIFGVGCYLELRAPVYSPHARRPRVDSKFGFEIGKSKTGIKKKKNHAQHLHAPGYITHIYVCIHVICTRACIIDHSSSSTPPPPPHCSTKENSDRTPAPGWSSASKSKQKRKRKKKRKYYFFHYYNLFRPKHGNFRLIPHDGRRTCDRGLPPLSVGPSVRPSVIRLCASRSLYVYTCIRSCI